MVPYCLSLQDALDFMRGGVHPCPVDPSNIQRMAVDPHGSSVVISRLPSEMTDGLVDVIDAVKITDWIYVVRATKYSISSWLVHVLGRMVNVFLRGASQFATAAIDDMGRCGGITPMTLCLVRVDNTWRCIELGHGDSVQRVSGLMRVSLNEAPDFAVLCEGYVALVKERVLVEALQSTPLEFKRLAMNGNARFPDGVMLMRGPHNAALATYNGRTYCTYDGNLRPLASIETSETLMPSVDREGEVLPDRITAVRRTADGLDVSFKRSREFVASQGVEA